MYQRFSSQFKRNLGRVVTSIALMAIACTAVISTMSFEAAPVGLLVAALMAPAPILFAVIERVMPSKVHVKQVAYFTYFGPWILMYIYVYLTGDSYIPEVALIALTLISIAAVSGYIPLVWTGRFSLRAALIGMMVVAAVLGLAIVALK